jgi:hypothetical protein
MPDEVVAMDALEAPRDHGLDAEELRALGAQSRDEPEPYSSPAKTTVGVPLRDISHGGVVDEHLVAGGWNSVTPPSSRVPSARAVSIRFLMRTLANVPAHHDLVVAAARAVAVEVGLHHAVLDQPLAGGRVLLDRAGRRDVVRGDRVAEDAERARTDDVARSRPASA